MSSETPNNSVDDHAMSMAETGGEDPDRAETTVGEGGGGDYSKHGTDAPSNSDSEDRDFATGGVKRDNYFAFIPQVGAWGANVVMNDARNVTDAVVGFPSWSARYGSETFNFYKANPRILYDEIISGFTVAIMQVPESIAFSFVAGVPPLSGLHATFWMATITGIFGGKPGMISGAAGALAVVVTELTIDNGVLSYLTADERLNVLYMTMFLCGIFQILFAVFRMAKLVRLIPETGMIGFMNGLAIIIFMAQLTAFMKCEETDENGELLLFVQCKVSQREWLTFQDDTMVLVLVLVHVAICMFIMQFFRKAPYVGKIVPSSLVALLVGTLLEHTLFRRVFDIETRTVGDTATMSGSLPQFDWPTIPTDSKTITNVIIYAITLAAIGSVESVLTLQACNEITDTVPKVSDSNQELFAQGLANLVCGLFRAMGGDAMIGQSTINIMNGARYRVSSTTSGLFMLLFVVAISAFIELLPIATLTGVLFMVVLSTFQWQTFHILRYGRLSDSCVILIVTIIAVFFNLAVAIAAGVVFSALVHAWDSGALVESDIELKDMIVNGEKRFVKYVRVRGSIFFSSSRHFINMFSVSEDPDTVIIDLRDALVIDHSAVAAIQGITHRFKKVDKTVLLTNIPKKSNGRLHRTGDHEVLANQITPESNIVGIPGVADTTDGRGGATTTTTMTTTITTTTAGHPHEPTPKALSDLAMFSQPTQSVDDRLVEIEDEQGRVSLHGINN